MTIPVEESFGVGHEAKDKSAVVANTSDCTLAAVVVVAVAQHDLAIGFERRERGIIGCDEAALAMRDGQLRGFAVGAKGWGVEQILGPDADGGSLVGDWHPAIAEACVLIVGKGDCLDWCLIWPGQGGWAWEKPDLDEGLEAVAGTDDGASSLDGTPQGGVEAFSHFHGEDSAARDVIAITEAARKTEEVEGVDACGIGDQRVEMQELDLGTGQFEGAAHFGIAVGAWGAEHQGAENRITGSGGHATRIRLIRRWNLRCSMLRYMVSSLAAIAFTHAGFAQLAHEKYQLANGMTVILHQDKSVPRATINLWYRVGARNEPAGRSGFAHLFEHLMFMGTTRVPGSDFDVLMETGGGANNASTSLDRTNYFSSGPASLLPTLLWLDADRLEDMGLNMNLEKLDKQRDVVRNERRQTIENAPYGKAYEATYQLMYPPSHPYYNGVIGTHHDLEAAAVQDVKDFFATFYQPNNCSLVVAGDFDPSAIKPLVEQLFGSLPSGNVAQQRVVPSAKLDRVIRVTTLDKVQLPALMIAYHSPAQFTDGDAELDLAGTILADGNNSRLYQRLVVQEQLASEVSAGQDSAALGSIFRIGVFALPGADMARIEAIVDEEVALFTASGPTGDEVARAQAKYELNLVASLQSIEARADRLNQYEYSFSNPDSLQRDLNRYRNATTESVKAWTGAVLRGDARLIQRVLAEEPERETSARDTRPVDAPMAAFVAPTPEAATLVNGARLMVFSRPGLPLVGMDIVFTPVKGVALDTPAKAGRSALMADMLDEGAGVLSAEQFADALQAIGASFDAGAAKESFSASMTVLKRGVDRGMELMAMALSSPRLAESDWSRVQGLHIENLKQADQNAPVVAGKVAAKLLLGESNPYGAPTGGSVRTTSALTLDDIRAAKDAILNPANATIIISGDITKDEAIELATRHFAGWQAGTNEKWASPMSFAVPAPEKSGLRVFVVDRPGAVQTVLHLRSPSVTSGDSNRVALDLLNTILGGSFTSRLNQNLREKNGYTYGARSGFALNPSLGMFTASTSVKAEQTGPALREFMGELTRIRSGDISDAEATKARETVRADMVGSFGTISGVTGLAAQMVSSRLAWDAVASDIASVGSVDATKLNLLAKQSINMDAAVLVLVGDKALVLEQIKSLVDDKTIPSPTVVNNDGQATAEAK